MNKNTEYFKHICIICHYAQQPPYNTMLRYHNWGKLLVKKGYRVDIIAASTVHNTDIDVIDCIKDSNIVNEGINYYYIKTPKYNGNGIKRVKNMLSFCLGLKKYKNYKSEPDVVIISGAYLYSFTKKIFKEKPIITDTTDLWPESIIEYAGISKTNPIIKFLYMLEKNAYLKSDALIFSMEGGIDYLREQRYSSKINFEKVSHINMGCDMEEFDHNQKKVADPLPWDFNKFNIVYCGSVRQANQVKQICDAGKKLAERGNDDIILHIYGNGSELDFLKKYVADNEIKNINFYGRIEKEKIPYILSCSKINLLTYKQVNLMKYGGSQSKLFDYLASGRPIISNAKFGYNLIDKFECGFVTENQSAEAFADAIEKMKNLDDKVLELMGENSRKTALEYDQPILVDQLCRVIRFLN